MSIALGIACLACQILQEGKRTDHLRLQFRHDDAQTGGGANESEQASLLDQTIQNRSRASRHATQQVNHHVQGDIKGFHLRLQGHLQLQGMQDLSQDQRDPQLDQNQFWASRPPDLQAQLAFEQLESQFNGTITNDKFCLSRMGRLQLTWWRLPLRARLPVTNQTGYPTDVNEMECCHQEGTHEETSLEHPASQERDGRCATPVGSSLPVSCPME